MALMEQRSIGVVYLARFAEGLAAFERFAKSYKANPAGGEHDLIVVYKGFPSAAETGRARDVFRDIPHISVQLEDTGYDIGSYLAVSRCVSHKYLLFLNTYTELLSPGWLTHYRTHATRDGVGIVGAMGSFESLFNSFGIIQSVIWMCNQFQIPYDKALHKYCDFVIDLYCKSWVATMERGSSLSKKALATDKLRRRKVVAECYGRWLYLTQPGQVFSDYRQFPSFPNPHVRSNGFMVRRESMLDLKSSDIESKLDACAFESGMNGLTSKLRRAGYAAVIVDRWGNGFDVEDWWRAPLFRVSDQEGLMLVDNQTRQFLAMSEGARAAHVRMTWGDYLAPEPADFPLLPFGFGEASLAPGPMRSRTFARIAAGSAFAVVVKAGRTLLNAVGDR